MAEPDPDPVLRSSGAPSPAPAKGPETLENGGDATETEPILKRPRAQTELAPFPWSLWPWVDAEGSAETRRWLALMVPVALNLTGRIGQSATDLAFLGHLSTEYLAAASLGLIWQMVSAQWLWEAYAGALNTLCSQAFGAKNNALVGVWLQTSVWCVLITCVPVALGWWYTQPVLAAAGFDEHQAELAATFNRWSLVGIAPQGLYWCLGAYMRAQNIVNPTTYVALVMLLVNAGLNYVFIYSGVPGLFEGLGFVGSPLATATTRTLGTLALWAYAVLWKRLHEQTWPGWSRAAVSAHRLKEFVVRQSVPLAIGRALEEWQLQLISFFAARMGAVQLSAHNLSFETFFIVSAPCNAPPPRRRSACVRRRAGWCCGLWWRQLVCAYTLPS